MYKQKNSNWVHIFYLFKFSQRYYKHMQIIPTKSLSNLGLALSDSVIQLENICWADHFIKRYSSNESLYFETQIRPFPFFTLIKIIILKHLTYITAWKLLWVFFFHLCLAQTADTMRKIYSTPIFSFYDNKKIFSLVRDTVPSLCLLFWGILKRMNENKWEVLWSIWSSMIPDMLP